MPCYREFPNDQQAMPPFIMKGVGMRTFVVPASLSALNDYCVGLLNFPGISHFTPAAPIVYIGMNRYADMESTNPEAAGFGRVRQHEYWVMFPAIRYSVHASGLMLPSEMTWIFPFIGVDNACSAFTGQEVLGFQKQIGKMTYDDFADGSFASDVMVPGFAGDNPSELQTLLPLLRIRAGRPTLRIEQPTLDDCWLGGSRAGLADIADATARLLMQAMVPGLNSVTNLKQFRDSEFPDQAVYQALVRCEWQISNPQDFRLYGNDTEIRVFDSLQMPVVKGLGLQTRNGTDLAPLLGFGMTCDMVIHNISRTVIH